jgi:hypothetical protein
MAEAAAPTLSGRTIVCDCRMKTIRSSIWLSNQAYSSVAFEMKR